MQLNWRVKLNNSDEIYLYSRDINKNYDINMWFVFPGCESFALSSLGYLWLYHKIDMMKNVNIERIYSDTKTTNIMKDKIDLIAFSLSFDMDFLEVLNFLDRNNYDFKAKDRNNSDPLIYAGGPVVTANPEPYKNIFDFFIIGDGEDLNLEIIKFYAENKNLSKSEKLKLLSKIDGIYVPSIKQEKVIKQTKKNLSGLLQQFKLIFFIYKNTFIPHFT